MRAGTHAAILAFSVATTLVTLAAFVAPALARRSGRASRIVIASLAWNAFVIGPIYFLGLTDRLYANVLAPVVAAVALVVLGMACLRLGSGLALREILRTAATFVRLPFDAFVIARREGGFGTVVVPIAFGIGAWLSAMAVLEPTWGDWDCLWYHEPMIGFAIQNHGFAMVPLEPYAQKINGYPRLTEMTMLYFGIFHGRWAIDLVNPLFLPLLSVSTYALCRDLGARMSTAIVFGASMVLLPGVVRLVPTTMVDPHATALFVAACFYACRRHFGRADAVLGIVAVTAAIGAKTFLWVPAFFLCLTLLVRILRRGRRFGAVATLGLVAFGVSATLGMLAFTAYRNYVHFHNPLWPDLKVDIPRLGIHWPGNYVYEDPNRPLTEQVNADIPWTDFLKRLYARPFTVNNGHDWQIIDYGLGAACTLLPLGALFTVLASSEAIVRLLFRRACPDPERRGTHASILRIALPLVVSVAASPAPYIGRYHLGMLAMAAAVLCGHASLRRRDGYLEGIAAVLAIGSLVTVAWNDRGWIASPSDLETLARTPAPERYVREELGSAIRRSTGLARERELGPGDVVVFERIAFVALLWNDHYTNRVRWLEDFPDPFVKADEFGATWIYAGRGGWFDTHAREPERGWELVGELETERFGHIYRRRRR